MGERSWKRILIYFGVISVVFLLVISYWGYTIIQKHRTLKPISTIDHGVSEEVYSNILDKTVSIIHKLEDPKIFRKFNPVKWRARGYYDEKNGFLITNNHVINSFCKFPECKSIVIYPRRNHEYKPNYKLFNVIWCSLVFDYCYLEQPGSKSYENLKSIPIISEQNIDEEVFIMPDLWFEDIQKYVMALNVGTLTHILHPILNFKITTTGGYSGAPLFKKNGDFVGIVVGTGFLDLLDNLSSFINGQISLHFGRFAEYTRAVSSDYFMTELNCIVSNEDKSSCVEKFINNFIKFLVNFNTLIASKNFFFENKRVVSNIFVDDFFVDLGNYYSVLNENAESREFYENLVKKNHKGGSKDGSIEWESIKNPKSPIESLILGIFLSGKSRSNKNTDITWDKLLESARSKNFSTLKILEKLRTATGHWWDY